MPLLAHRSQRAGTAGFTLLELMIVVMIIGVLASLLIPAISSIRSQADLTECKNNLRGIGRSIKAWQMEHNKPDDIFPAYLGRLISYSEGLGDDINPAIFVCPFDPSKGKGHSGRAQGGDWGNFSYLYERERNHPEHPIDLSYMYEVSGAQWVRTAAGEDPQPGDIDHWIDTAPLDTPPAGESAWHAVDGDWDTTRSAITWTWADYKRWQQAHGNYRDASWTVHAPWPKSQIPIVRCFHHFNWQPVQAHKHMKEVWNLGWDCQHIYQSSPQWEADFSDNY
ncbi:MAG: type II secretion system protein [Planctomycetota bacterium]